MWLRGAEWESVNMASQKTISRLFFALFLCLLYSRSCAVAQTVVADTGIIVTHSAAAVNKPPTVAFVTAHEQMPDSPATVEFEISASDADGAVRLVTLYLLGNGAPRVLGMMPPPFRLIVTNLVTHGGRLMAVAEDNLGLTNSVSLDFTMRGPPGDEIERPYLLTGESARILANNAEATRQNWDASDRTLWWEWIAPTNGFVYVSTIGSTYDTILHLGTNMFDYPPLLREWNDDWHGDSPSSMLKFEATGGRKYFFCAGSIATDETGDLRMQMDFHRTREGTEPPPLNDLYVNRRMVEGTNTVMDVSNIGATGEPSEPRHCGFAAANSVWFGWKAPFTGELFLGTTNSTFDPRISFYRPHPEINKLIILSQSDDRLGFESGLHVRVTAEQEYVICLDGFAGQTGSGQMRLVLSPPVAAQSAPENDAFENATRITGPLFNRLARTAGATTQAGEPKAIDVANQFSVWWFWEAEKAVPVHASVVGAAELRVYQGRELESLQAVASVRAPRRPESPIQKRFCRFQAVPGQRYYFLVASRVGASNLDFAFREMTELIPFELSASPGAEGQFQLGLVSSHVNSTIEWSADFATWRPLVNLPAGTNKINVPRPGEKFFLRGLTFE